MTDGRYRRPESVLVVVYTEAREVLLIQRADLPEFWQSVTGTLEPEESAAAAARRELAEETGLQVIDLVDRRMTNRFRISRHWATRYAPGVTENTEHVFTARLPCVVPIKLNPTEHLACDWCSAESAMARCSSATNRAAIERFVCGSDE